MKTARMLVILVLALALTAHVANADFTFGTPTNLGPTINSSAGDGPQNISDDGLELYFRSNRSDGYGDYDLWVTIRATISDPWGPPVNLGPTVNTSALDSCPSISSDGLLLFLHSTRTGGSGGADLWVTERPTVSEPWATPVNLGPPVNTSALDACPDISTDGLSLFFGGNAPGGSGDNDIWMSTRATILNTWDPPVNLGPIVNTSAYDCCPSISANGLVLFFHSTRHGGYGGDDIWVTIRATTDNDWGTPVNLGPTVNTSAHDFGPDVSSDGSTIFFASNRPGGVGSYDLWQVSIEPVVDFNGDEIVDIHDLLILIEHWGTDEPLCDIAPMPFGDGIVDVQDLEVLMSYWQQEVLPVSLLAYWKLDETEGPFAADSAGQHDGTLHEEPLWQPTGGQIDGALQLDGIDDYVSTGFVLNPEAGEFSVFAWVKGGVPGQVVLSQMGGVNWLCTDSLEGNLMTELKSAGRGTTAMLSQTIITDGNWHRIGLVWDGSHGTLYVDEVAVAEDTQNNLEASENGLYIGAGTAMEPGSFWSGLIDDVRIYNRAVNP